MKKSLLLALLATIIGAGSIFSLVHFGAFWSPTVVTAVACPHSTIPPEKVSVGIQPRNDCTPSFTEQDVRAYFRSGFGMHGIQVSNIIVTRVLFTTSADASRLMGKVSTGVPGNTVVCYVEIHGTVTGQATFLTGQSVNGDDSDGGTLRVVFNAHSGETLVDGLS